MTAKNHHFVPVSYLRGFLDPNEVAQGQHVLWRYRPGEKPVRKGPKGVAAEEFFYQAPETPGHEDDTEPVLAEIESLVAPHLEKLRAGDIGLSPQEKGELSSFIALCFTRTVAYRDLVNSMMVGVFRLRAKKILETEGELDRIAESVTEDKDIEPALANKESIRRELQAVVAKERTVTQQSKGWTIKQAFERSTEYSDLFEGLTWLLLEAPDGEAFITSDNPVILIDPGVVRGSKRYRHSSLLQFHFPVCSRYYLVGAAIPPPVRHSPIRPEYVAALGENQMRHARREVYASYRSAALQEQLNRVFRERDPLIKELPEDLLDR